MDVVFVFSKQTSSCEEFHLEKCISRKYVGYSKSAQELVKISQKKDFRKFEIGTKNRGGEKKKGGNKNIVKFYILNNYYKY